MYCLCLHSTFVPTGQLLGLQILKMANQLTNGPMTPDLNGQSLPMFDTLLPNLYKESNSGQSWDKNNVNHSYSIAKPDPTRESNNFSKRMGLSDTLSQRNQSIHKYSKHKIIPKPYPYSYSSGSTGSEQNRYVFPNSGSQESEAQRKLSSRYIKPDWNRFEDSIDESLAEPKNYPKNYDKESVKNDEKRSDNRDNSYSTDDSFDTDYYNEHNEPQTEEPEEADITSEPFDFDLDKEDDKEDKDDTLNDYRYDKRTFNF